MDGGKEKKENMCRRDITYRTKDLPHWYLEMQLQVKLSLRHVRHVNTSCTGQAANSRFGEDGGEWASLLLTPKICQVLQIDRLDTGLCALC